MDGEKADIIYTDPPWGEAFLKYFHKHAGLEMTDTWPEFVQRLGAVYQANLRPGGHLVIEMGLRWVDEFAEVLSDFGFPETARWNVTYGPKKKPITMGVWYSGPGFEIDRSLLHGTAVTATNLRLLAQEEPGGTVLDPCCGKGMVAKYALREGFRFVGTELFSERAAKTQAVIDRAEKRRR